jgi:hypothetical protein
VLVVEETNKSCDDVLRQELIDGYLEERSTVSNFVPPPTLSPRATRARHDAGTNVTKFKHRID